MSKDKTYAEFRREMLSHRRHLAETLVANQLASDRTVLTLAAGALVLSVTLLADVFTNPKGVCWLEAAWLLLSMSLVSVAVSYWFTVRETRKRLTNIDKWLEREPNDGEPVDVDHTISEALNAIGLLAMIAGITLLAYFASVNIN